MTSVFGPLTLHTQTASRNSRICQDKIIQVEEIQQKNDPNEIESIPRVRVRQRKSVLTKWTQMG
jgi:hypothetical protein